MPEYGFSLIRIFSYTFPDPFFVVFSHKVYQNTCFLWSELSRIRTESMILYLYGKIRPRENLNLGILYAVNHDINSNMMYSISSVFQVNVTVAYEK